MTVVNLVQLLNVSGCIYVTFDGIVIFFNELQPLKDALPNDSNEFGKLIEVSLMQYRKEYRANVFSLLSFGIVTVLRL